MIREWAPSIWGRLSSGSGTWKLQLIDERVELVIGGRSYYASVSSPLPLRMHRGLFWTRLTLRSDAGVLVTAGGLPNANADALNKALGLLFEAQARRSRQKHFDDVYGKICSWLGEAYRQLQAASDDRRWITQEQQQEMLGKRPDLSMEPQALWQMFRHSDVQAGLSEPAEQVEQNLARWEADWRGIWSQWNERHTRQELIACKDLLDSVESRPLSGEQARAVICFDNRVQVVASAGSGKTSTMVAKAAYALQRGFVSPEQIIMLAFNKKAAEELEERAVLSFKRLGMHDAVVEATTFHALGRRIIGKARGRMPKVPEWESSEEKGLEKLADIVDELKSKSLKFRTTWDIFRLVFGRDLSELGGEMPADEWDRDGTGYVRTLRGDRVRSFEEYAIANWLFYNGVKYEYERAYEFDTTTHEYAQYHPDFYYPDIKLYHEHLALDAQGRPPPKFARYLESLAWKRGKHKECGTDLVETTSHQFRTDQLFTHLSKALTDRGLKLEPNPDRSIPPNGHVPMDHEQLIRLVRVFLRHAKSNCLTGPALAERLKCLPENSFTLRHRMFLSLIAPIREAWDAALAEAEGIDFEDMINEAAEHLERGRVDPPYRLIMVDEFQDASRARARLCRALVQQPGRHLFVVGDDWQSINRFAGADVSVMTGFVDWFGHGQVLKLEQTFRCPQQLCDVSSRFVSKNPAQIPKRVWSTTPTHGPVLQAYQVPHRDRLQSAIGILLAQLHRQLCEETVAASRGEKVSVFILGRYNTDQKYVPPDWKSSFGDRIKLSFLTMHGSKGAEADYVILPGMILKGFPNERADDPVLALAMPNADTFIHSEERRLFYVALTRARRSAILFTVRGYRSPFLDELLREHATTLTDIEGESIDEEPCPVCKHGVIVRRNGPYGTFLSCSNYPKCKYKPPKRAAQSASTPL